MEAQPVDGLWAPWGCQAAPGLEQLSWAEPGALQASLAGTCGDAYFYGGGDDGSKLLFFKEFGLQIEQDGRYRALVDQGGGNAEPLFVRIESCPGTEFASLLVEAGTPGSMPFYAGQHFVRVYYPRDLDLVGEPRLEIEFVGPY